MTPIMARLAVDAKPLAKSRAELVTWHAKLEAAADLVNEADARGLKPTVWLPEAWGYFKRAHHLNYRNIGTPGYEGPCGDQLQDNIPIYDTVRRRYAGFSNVLEQLFYGNDAPKYQRNLDRGLVSTAMPWTGTKEEWLYVCLCHRITGSGASFEADHGWRNSLITDMSLLKTVPKMAEFWRMVSPKTPCFTSIGNQIPPFQKQTDPRFKNSGCEYLATVAPKLVKQTVSFLKKAGKPLPIQQVVHEVLKIHTELGQRRFVFVLTAWVMDIAEYCPHWVDPNSDVFHGSNAQRCIRVLFEGVKGQTGFDAATRLFADATETWPMDVEDVECDSVRWLTNYVPKKGFDHIHKHKLYNSASLRFTNGP
ncbi:MAG: hypothetical protein PHU06_06250 [Gallionella sp.]|nr:hypothetical protein [Gallionella sp.]MDD4958433.1 hypothetical protein [Gallionella sp.]